jgi:hypothetical protein
MEGQTMRLYAIRASLEDTEVDLTINLEAITRLQPVEGGEVLMVFLSDGCSFLVDEDEAQKLKRALGLG